MSDVVITKTAGCCGDCFPNCATVTIRNFSCLSIELCSPISSFPLPEEDHTQAVLVKAEGNILKIRLSWLVMEEACSISSASCVKTVQEQLCFFVNTFEPNSIEDAYKISVDGLTETGWVRKISFVKQGAEPVTYRGTIEFIAGDVIAADEE